MAYKKPQVVAKSSAKKSYVAGCPVKTCHWSSGCDTGYAGSMCEINRSK